MPISIAEYIEKEIIKYLRYRKKPDFAKKTNEFSKHMRKMKRLENQILSKGLMVETTPGFRRCAYPEIVELCDGDCNADYKTCCHRYVLEGIASCREDNLKNRLTHGTDYILQRRIGDEWVEVQKEKEFEGRIKTITKDSFKKP